MLDGPFADPQARRAHQDQALRRTARRLGRLSPHYRELFGSIDLDAKGLKLGDMASIPVTSKAGRPVTIAYVCTLHQGMDGTLTVTRQPPLRRCGRRG